jgi:hypothetical protein
MPDATRTAAIETQVFADAKAVAVSDQLGGGRAAAK